MAFVGQFTPAWSGQGYWFFQLKAIVALRQASCSLQIDKINRRLTIPSHFHPSKSPHRVIKVKWVDGIFVQEI